MVAVCDVNNEEYAEFFTTQEEAEAWLDEHNETKENEGHEFDDEDDEDEWETLSEAAADHELNKPGAPSIPIFSVGHGKSLP